MLEPITTVVIPLAPLSSSNVPPLPSESPSSKEAVAVGEPGVVMSIICTPIDVLMCDEATRA